METEIQYTFIWQQLANLPLWFPFFLLFWWVCHQNIYIILQSVRLETCDWDHRGITKVFTRITDQGSRRVIFLQTFQQSGFFFFSNQKSRPLQATKKNGCCIHCTFSTLKLQSLKNYLPSSTFKVTYKTAFSLETKLNVDHQRHCACSDRKQQVRARCNHWKRVNLDQHWHRLWLRDSHRHARNPLHHETHDR